VNFSGRDGADVYDLRAPNTPQQWRYYHDIRRQVLWESRGRFGVYDEAHPDEYKPGNFPLLLTLAGEAIGVLRIDIDGTRAIFRRVAIRESWQGQGHGRQLMRMAEGFAKDRGCRHLFSDVDPEAVGFYEKCGFERNLTSEASEVHVAMEKWLSGPD
jgi:GNAT superfamily N-acetyltransferase